MNIFDTMKISASALKAQRIRLNVISSNLANIETTRTPEGGPYRKKNVVFQSTRLDFGDRLDQVTRKGVQGVRVPAIVESNRMPRRVFDPGHPDADSDGYVAKPDINPVEEMTDMMSATKAYEANANVIKAAKRMALKALEIGR
ncbi:flagellar basal body rod protein FlgC [Geothermobacter hydrogeniphilus]|uniref:Flagellar basal-body rod protein FlgC n=1 Tax=Geothermobacter hydrogeniphilus TaxID=1969733 RepID=A0A1X0YED9_9BACT|nr:flagellar basal body rod protein FlgC [Geothermobacter hydrogeniphilus]ORJ63528.1 flagellar basal body rod protein FlgC [Geothermobacter hydrogeniphilus]